MEKKILTPIEIVRNHYPMIVAEAEKNPQAFISLTLKELTEMMQEYSSQFIKSMKIKVKKVFIPAPEKNEAPFPVPVFDGMKCITTTQVEISGMKYDQYEFIPEHIDLCEGGNAKREGDEIIFTG